MDSIKLTPIGTVRSHITEAIDENWGNVISTIKVNTEWSPGLLGLDLFSHAVIITFLHQAFFDREKHLQRRPRNWSHLPLLGIFAQRAKNRPNPIGITVVKIMSILQDELVVQGLDAVDGTPVLDIKPYFLQYDHAPDPITPAWVAEIMQGYF
jgi:tRNA-Thr(GGU) m(6)t(6)A37 methyltransferase TsaA